MMEIYRLTHLLELEAESIYVIREVAAQFERPVLLFSGGKDSIVMYHLARKAFRPWCLSRCYTSIPVIISPKPCSSGMN